jgi:dihydroorotate dehydrogenase (NAD+) catalytic subunit
MTASGTSGSSNELQRLFAVKEILSSLGAFVTKGVTLKARSGNPRIRVVETRGGILNSIGLQNRGAALFLQAELPKLLAYELPIFVNISAGSVDEFGELTECLANNDTNRKIAGIEINVSCPNICEGGVAFGANPKRVEEIVRRVKRCVRKDMLVITKLTPNVTDITLPAKAAIAGGTDALSMINTVRGMAIDVYKRRPFLGNITGGLSGPAIRPVGVYMVYECFRSIPECQTKKVPIVGIGGITNWMDAMEYIMAGASAVAIGTAWFVNPRVFIDVKKDIVDYCERNNVKILDLIGCAHG